MQRYSKSALEQPIMEFLISGSSPRSTVQIFCILPPFENAIILDFNLIASDKTLRVSSVFPDILVVTTKLSEFTVLGN